MDPSRTQSANHEDAFLSEKPTQRLKTLLFDFYSFVTFLIFLLLVYAIGVPLYLVDSLFGTRTLDSLVRLFCWFAGSS